MFFLALMWSSSSILNESYSAILRGWNGKIYFRIKSWKFLIESFYVQKKRLEWGPKMCENVIYYVRKTSMLSKCENVFGFKHFHPSFWTLSAPAHNFIFKSPMILIKSHCQSTDVMFLILCRDFPDFKKRENSLRRHILWITFCFGIFLRLSFCDVG